MMQSSSHEIQYGRSRITFQVVLSDRDRLQITVFPDMSVEVQAPHGKPLEAVLGRVKRRAAWIVKQLRFFEQFQPRPAEKQFIAGETFRYLGRQYRLKLVCEEHAAVRLSRPYLIVSGPNPKDRSAIQKVVREWYQSRAKAIFSERLDALFESSNGHFPHKPRLRVQRMIRRWGSCTEGALIVLNPALIQAPLRCVDYVIIHELCHLRHRDHGRRFVKLLARLLPDWACAKGRLESIEISVV